jgi:hypothetical protein
LTLARVGPIITMLKWIGVVALLRGTAHTLRGHREGTSGE